MAVDVKAVVVAAVMKNERSCSGGEVGNAAALENSIAAGYAKVVSW